MKKVFLFSVMALIGCVAFSQSKPKFVDLVMGNELKVSKKESMISIFASDETGVYALKSDGKGFYGLNSNFIVQHYDNKMKLTHQEQIDLKYQDKDKDLEGTIDFGDNIIFLTSFINQKTKMKYLFMQSLNRNTLVLNDDIKKIGEINFEGETKFNSGGFGFNVSQDSSKLLVYYNKPYQNKENEEYGFTVFDIEINQLWSKEVVLPYSDKLFIVSDYIVDDDGNVHLLGRLYKDKIRSSKGGKPNYKYLLLSYYSDEAEPKEYEISLKDEYITDLKIAINENKIICAGFYSENAISSIKGSFFFGVDMNTKLISDISLKEFDLNFITQNLTDKQSAKIEKKNAKGKNVEMYEYDLDNLILRDDGGVVLVGEQFFIQTVTSTSTGANGVRITTTNYYYHYNDIIVVNINPDGEIDWAQKIGKRQRTYNDGGYYSSYALAVSGDKMYFVFNDNGKNLLYNGRGTLYPFSSTKNALAMLVVMDSEGNQKREALFAQEKKSAILRPMLSNQIDKKSLVVYCTRKNLEKFVKITAK